MRAVVLFLVVSLVAACGDKTPPMRADPTPTPWNKAPRSEPIIVGVAANADGARYARYLVEERGFGVIAASGAEDELVSWARARGVQVVDVEALDDDVPAIVWADAPSLARLDGPLSDKFGNAYASIVLNE